MKHVGNSVKLFAVACGVALAAFIATHRAQATEGFRDGSRGLKIKATCSGSDKRTCIETKMGNVKGTWHQTIEVR